MARIAIVGGGPAGYEAAFVAAQHGAEVVLAEADGLGGACVLYDCVPSKAFAASAQARLAARAAPRLGVRFGAAAPDVDMRAVHGRVTGLALAQSADVRARLERAGVQLLDGTARLADETPGLARHRVVVGGPDGVESAVQADHVLLASGASPRILPGAEPDGQRILTWRQLYELPELPSKLVVVGSGVTGAEFVSAYAELGVDVTLVSSRDRVLPGEDADAADVLERVLADRGVTLVNRGRAQRVDTVSGGVVVSLDDGRTVRGSHALMTVGSVPNTGDLGLQTVGVAPDERGYIAVDRVSRTAAPGVYAAGDCTGLLPLASVAGMQGRIAMWHALGQGVAPLRLRTVSAAVFTAPEIATVGVSQHDVDHNAVDARAVTLPLATNARSKMQALEHGFVKLFCRRPTGVVVGGVIVAPAASELILPIGLAVRHDLTVQDLVQTLAVYPALSGSITEAARQLSHHDDLE